MKINFTTPDMVAVRDIACGDTFTDSRRSNPKEMGIYMKVDAHTARGLVINTFDRVAVNLETGQLKVYKADAMVTPVHLCVQVD